MEGSIFDIKRFAVHDGRGIRTTVFFKGCSLKCIWCHNPEGIYHARQLGFLAHKCVHCGACAAVCPSGAHTLDAGHSHHFDRSKCLLCGKCASACRNKALALYGQSVTVEEILPALLQDKDFFDESHGGVTLSGGEALLQADFCVELLQKLKEAGVDTAVDTCGFVPAETFRKVLPYTDTFLYDMKHMDSRQHQRLTGHPNELILENLRMICEMGAQIEIRIPLVPDCNDDPENMHAMGRFLQGLKGINRVKVLPYHEFARTKYASLAMEDTMPHVRIPEDPDLHAAVNILRSYGLNAVSGKEA